MTAWVFNIADKLIHPYYVSQEKIGNKKRNNIENNKLGDPLPYLFRIPGHGAKLLLFSGVSINPIFNFTKDHFHEYGLGAGPSTKNTAKDNRKQNHKYHECKKANGKYEKILRPENHTEKYELTFKNIEHEKRCIIYFYEW